MNTLNYIGCKKTLYDRIFSIIKSTVNDSEIRSFADLFAGTGIVGYSLQDHFDIIISNDLEYYSYIINCGLLQCNYSEKIKQIVNECNRLDGVNGLIYKNYSPNPQCERMFFTNANAKKCDAIRTHITGLLMNNEITEAEFKFLLASLLVSVDKVANTASVYGAYLKKFKKSAEKVFELVPIHIGMTNNVDNVVTNDLAENIVKNTKFDVVYLDPPYNHRQYGANYSPLNYIAHYNEHIVLKGKTGLIENYNKSDFCSKIEVKNAMNELIDNIDANYLIMSYSNDGLLGKAELKEVFLKRGRVVLYIIKYKKYKSSIENNDDVNSVLEYLWVVDLNESDKSYSEIAIE